MLNYKKKEIERDRSYDYIIWLNPKMIKLEFKSVAMKN